MLNKAFLDFTFFSKVNPTLKQLILVSQEISQTFKSHAQRHPDKHAWITKTNVVPGVEPADIE